MIARLLARIVALIVAARMALRGLRGRRVAGDALAAAEPTAGGGASPDSSEDVDPSEREVPANRGAETLVAALLLAAAVFGFGFTAVYVVEGLNDQLLGIAIGGMFMLLAAAAIIAGKRVVVQETSVEERGTLLEAGAPEEITDMVTSGFDGVSRRLLLTGAAGVAGAAAVTAAVTPVASVGPRLSMIHKTPWHRGRRFVDVDGHLYAAKDIAIGSFYTALPEGASPDDIGSPLIVVRLPPSSLKLPSSRKDWAPEGILAFSKICPHAACAISLYRYPQFPADGNDAPALTCPCHYSTFLPAEGGKLLFGPAGRPLPQLPVVIDSDGHLSAGGGFDEDIGPSWIDVRTPKQI